MENTPNLNGEGQPIPSENGSGQPIPNSDGNGTPTAEQLLALPDEELKKYGIDDPKSWKSYQKLLHKKESEWSQKWNEAELKRQEEQRQFLEKIQNLERGFGEIKNPPKQQEVLVEPVEPDFRQFGYATEQEALEDTRYLAALTKFSKEMAVYNSKVLKSTNEEYKKTKEQIEEERKIKAQHQANQQARASILGEFIKQGLDNNQAQEAFDLFMGMFQGKVEQSAPDVVAFYKFKKNIPLAPKPKEEKETFPMPAGIGGNGDLINQNPGSFTKTTKFSDLYQIK
jgi:hypothetical protein